MIAKVGAAAKDNRRSALALGLSRRRPSGWTKCRLEIIRSIASQLRLRRWRSFRRASPD